MLDEIKLSELIASAFKEDVGDGDYSSNSCISKDATGKAILKIKQQGVLAGVDVARYIFNFADESIIFNPIIADGATIHRGEIAFEVTGSIQSLLKCERLVLNTMQRMSGIATNTKKYVDKISSYKTRLLDTRKTTPNFRLLEKEAVRIGGGLNHRFGLYDMIMLKDNHIDSCGGIEKAIQKANDYIKNHHLNLSIEIETRSIDDVIQVMKTGGINRIMFDNFSPAEINKALELVDRKYETEASGGIHYDNIELYAATGVDFISVGALIHQAQSIDLSMKCI
jgi:nicotinate-nucleotide pyrophosphorylase (carboxylating)